MKKKVGSKSLICHTTILNNVPNIPSFLAKKFAKYFRQCINPTHFEHVLYVHDKPFFDKN